MTRTRYRRIRKLASGGMGDVYLARQEAEGGVQRLVAVKTLKPELTESAEFLELFRNEARVAARLAHPNIVQVYDFGIESGTFFLAMEFVEGCTLREIMGRARKSNYPVPFDAIAALTIDLARALHYAHTLVDEDKNPLNIVHRDVSPGNIVVSFEGTAKVLDFGIAKASIAVDPTERLTLKGKLSYLSPEQARLEEVDRRSDIYSLGIILWELTTGKRLFNVEDPQWAARVIGQESVPPIARLRPDAPPGWEGIVRRALAPRREDRYATTLELQLDVERMAHLSHLVLSNLALSRLVLTLVSEEGLAALPVSIPQHRKPRLLAVDDEEEMLDLVRRSVRKKFEVHVAGSVPEALALLSRESFDIVLTDERMPGGRGLDLLKHIARTSPATSRLMMTAYASPDLMLEAINEGSVHQFLCKPFSPTRIADALDQVIAKVLPTAQAAVKREDADTDAGAMETITGVITVVESSVSVQVPKFAIPWETLAALSARLRPRVRSMTLILGVAARLDPVARGALERLVRAWKPECWLHIENHQVVVLVPEASADEAHGFGLELRAVLAQGRDELRCASVGVVELPTEANLVKAGAVAENNARIAWNKEPDYVVG